MKNSDSEYLVGLRRRVELYLRRTRTPASRFGRDTVNDPDFVFGLRKGRKVGESLAARVNAWLDRTYRQRRR